jgi:hypothetical protein
MQSFKTQLARFWRFVKGETVHDGRGQLKWFASMLSMAIVLGLLISPLIFLLARAGSASGNPGSGPSQAGAVTPAPSATASATSTPAPSANLPAKGMTDNPAYQWWRWPNHAQPDSWWGDGQNAQTLGKQISLMQELGVKLFRIELPWPFVAPAMPGGASYDSASARNPNWSGYQWSRMDLIVQLASAANIQLVPQVLYSPDWASGVTATISGGPNQPPQSAAYFGDFVTAAVTRYKGKIHFWEMWNEPDYPDHSWTGTPQQYVDLVLKPGYQAAKQVDPSVKVLIGGLAGDANMPAYYAAGAEPYFDIANFHAYYQLGVADSTAMDHIRSAMNQNGDSAKQVWMTEFGMMTDASGGGLAAQSSSAANDEAAQARLIHDVYGGLKVQAAFFYQLHDTGVYETGNVLLKMTSWGIVSHDLSHHKMGFDAYKQAAGGVLPNLASQTQAVPAPAAQGVVLHAIPEELSNPLSPFSAGRRRYY